MGKVIQFPKFIEEEVDEVIVPNTNNNNKSSAKKEEIKNETEEEIGVTLAKYVKEKPIEKTNTVAKEKKRANVFLSLVKFVSKFKLKNKIALGLIFVAVVSLAVVKAESTNNLDREYSYVESFNMGISKELEKEVGYKADNSLAQEDIVVTINPTLEGEEFALYTATIELSLKASDIDVKQGEKRFKVKDVGINVLDISPSLTTEDMAILPEDSIKTISKEAARLAKELKKELKKQDKYIEELIKSAM